jgi:hypothetical protein
MDDFAECACKPMNKKRWHSQVYLIACLIGAFPIGEKSMSAIFVVNVLPIGN